MVPKNLLRESTFFCKYCIVHDEHPVVGVIYNPATNEMFSCQKGKGVFLNGNKVNALKKQIY